MLEEFDTFKAEFETLRAEFKRDGSESVAKEFVPLEQELKALEEEFDQLETEDENIKKQVAEKRKVELQIKQGNNLRCNALKIKRDQEKQLKKTAQNLKKEIDLLKRNPLTENDQEKLKKSKIKLWMYEKCTGVVFDYSSKDPIKGFVQNPETNFLHTFLIPKNGNVEELLWRESSKAGALRCSQHSKQYQEK